MALFSSFIVPTPPRSRPWQNDPGAGNASGHESRRVAASHPQRKNQSVTKIAHHRVASAWCKSHSLRARSWRLPDTKVWRWLLLSSVAAVRQRSRPVRRRPFVRRSCERQRSLCRRSWRCLWRAEAAAFQSFKASKLSTTWWLWRLFPSRVAVGLQRATATRQVLPSF